MKIWLLLSRLDNGGLERVQINLAGAFQIRGHDVRIVAGQVNKHFRGQLPTGVSLIEVAPHGAAEFPFGLLKCLIREPPDCVFTTSNDVACMMLMIRRLVFRRLRVVVTQHSSLAGPLRHAKWLERTKLSLIHTAMRFLFSSADGIVAVSHQVAADLCRELVLNEDCVRVIHNPIVTPDFEDLISRQCQWPWPNDGIPVIVFVGRLSHGKRIDLLLAAYRNVRRDMPVRLLMVGSGPLRRWLEREAVQHGFRDDCALTGFVENVLPLIRQSHVLVLPSDYEGFGNVLVEAMACGTQVVATDCPHGPSEILDSGTYGQLVPTGDAVALEAAIRAVLEHRFAVPAETLKERAQAFTLDKAVDAYLKVLSGTV